MMTLHHGLEVAIIFVNGESVFETLFPIFLPLKGQYIFFELFKSQSESSPLVESCALFRIIFWSFGVERVG